MASLLVPTKNTCRGSRSFALEGRLPVTARETQRVGYPAERGSDKSSVFQPVGCWRFSYKSLNSGT